MYQDYFSVERFMRDHHRELMEIAARERLARSAARTTARERGDADRRPLLLIAALAGSGRALVNLGRRLERAAAAASRSRPAGFCEESPTSAGC